ncbi:MAG: hydantoinase B/oxoprolinase family protein [Chloroflexi bacterium]|nr:hydantoinase B/oxoprolinase family protein [Chloroflexota bacterium]
MAEKLDPVKFEVIRNALLEATEEMAIALRRSAYSTNIKTRADFSCAFFDRNLQAVAQAFTQAVHLGSMVELVPRVVRAYGPDNLGPGDVLLTNDPYQGGVHLNDITFISPVFYPAGAADGQLVGYVANLAHHVDVGGGAPASVGAFREVYQEGVIIPPVKLVRGGEMVADVFRLVLAQIRSKHETAGDFRAQVAANNTGIRRIAELMGRFGPETVTFYIDELIAYTERRTRAELAMLPRGAFATEGVVDNDGFTEQPVHLAAKVVIDAEGVLFDLTGCDPQRKAPVNSTFAQTFSACAYALKCLIDPDIPANAGFYRLVRVVAPLGSVVNCTAPAPVVGGWETQTRLTDVFFKALAPAIPDKVPAGTKAMMCHAGFGGIDPRTGEYYCFLETMAGGYGGRSQSDGPDAVQTHGQNTENAPVEETEINYPVRITRYELVENSEGAGKYRGGLGLRRDYLFVDHEVTFTILADRDRWGPWGLFGGLPGQRAEYILNPDKAARLLGSKVTLELEPGDVVSYRTCGGGGYGPPLERDTERVLRDARQGKVSVARAREIYGVVIDTAGRVPSTWTVDEAETSRLRAQ